MEKKTLSEYIASLQLILKEHGDMEVVRVTGREYSPARVPEVKGAKKDTDYLGFGYIKDDGKDQVCVIFEQYARDHPMYKALDEVYRYGY